MRLKTYRTRKKNKDQTSLFPQQLETKTEYWFDWRYSEIIQIQKAMLVQSIAEIRDRRKSLQMRKEAWDWLMNDFDGPFAAKLCASNNGYNIENLRILLRRLVKDIE
ncbi:hypothetical protein G6Z92_06180 [Vibrio aestuarianus subsp. cardii]|uniref:hypothetical protein n=1 Tax=Vibrio aestuarianus TaxID=28171 RepID=UPI0015C52B58|nr:hypothetical protein [Vibrio aestuarianus]NGZ66572.1 hypothetical protein [Vibrio aestuarianus subsp. cardii]